MKKVIIITTVILTLMLMLSACSSNSTKLADIYTEDDVITRAEEVMKVINTVDYNAVNAELRADLRDKLPADTLKEKWNPMLSKAGAFIEFTKISTAGQISKSTGEDYAVAKLICEYEKEDLTFTIVMDKDMEIVGLYLK